MDTLEVRPVSIINIDEFKTYDGLSPGTVILKANKRTFDIGAYCYAKRDKKAGTRSQVKKVVINTYCEKRARLVSIFIQLFLTLRHYRGNSLEAVVSKWPALKAFLDWCEFDFPDVDLYEGRRLLVKEYCEYLGLQYRLDENATNKYAAGQKSIIEAFSIAFDDEYIAHGIPLLKHSTAFEIPTEIPDDEVQEKSYSMCNAFYKGLSEFFVRFDKYPFKWTLPDYLGGELWMFPCIVKFQSPFNAVTDKFIRSAQSIDFEKGVVRSLDEAASLYNNRETARTCRNLMQKSIREANADPRHHRRIELANHAMTAFMTMFQAKTGMSLKQVTVLPWAGSYDKEKAEPKFRVLKWRAGGKFQTFRVSSDFIKFFEEFLVFRAVLLDGRSSQYLFFRLQKNGEVCQFDSQVLQRLEKLLRCIDNEFRLVRTREWRAAKSNVSISNFNVIIASDALQNEPKTIIDHYAQGSETEQKRQFKLFFERLIQRVVFFSTSLTETGAALCEDQGNPDPELPSPIMPDCKEDFGCFYCSHFKVHASESGVRKLLSCRYFVERMSYINPSDSSQSEWYQPIIDRIDEIVDYIKTLSESLSVLVEEVERSVYEENNFDYYWECKIEAMTQIGVF